MEIIDGKKIAAEIKAELKAKVDELKAKGASVGLATVLVGDDPASHIYVGNKIKTTKELGIESFHHPLLAGATEDEIILLIKNLNADARVSGILLQLPLPAGQNAQKCIEAIDPSKDVDGLHPYSSGRLTAAKSWKEIEEQNLLLPCTPLGVITLLKKYKVEIAGKNAVVVGRSNLVGKPIALMLLANDATVTIAHSRTKNLKEVCAQADILIAAIGKPKFITKDFIKPGAVVIDVGVNRLAQGLCGDVDFEDASKNAGLITPVPGGVGQMTIAMLMKNTVAAAQKKIKLHNTK